MKQWKKLDFEQSLLASWNLFFSSLVKAFQSYYNARQMMVSNSLRNLSPLIRQGLKELRKIPILSVLLAFSPYALYLVLFSLNQHIRHVTHLDTLSQPHLVTLARVEQTLFFCYPHRILSSLTNPLFDIVAAVPYLIHFPLPFLFAFYLAISVNRRKAFLPYLWCVGWVNFVAVIFQITYPTAPPWFVDSAVVDHHGDVVYESPSEAGFSRLDKLLGVSVFHGLYSTSPLKFGAFPSLHVALPMVIFLNHPWLGKKFGAFHVVLIALSAVYITHHYLVDALGGALLACVVRLSMLRVWSPFPELTREQTRSTLTNENLTSENLRSTLTNENREDLV